MFVKFSCSVFPHFCKIKDKYVKDFSVVPYPIFMHIYPVIFFLSIFWALKRGGNYQILWMKFTFYHQNFFLKKEIGWNLKKTIQQFQNNYSIYIGNVQRKQLSRRKITHLLKRRKNRIIKYNYMVDDFSQPRWQKLIKQEIEKEIKNFRVDFW